MNNANGSRPVAIWLMTGVFMVLVQALLGGITRLTGSGLSITEWDVVTGILPPLTHAQWLDSFQHYQASSQFRLLNSDFTLSDFRFIYFWEWFHRLWGRAIGLVFAIPFIWFLIKKRFRKEMIGPFVVLFLLGALQGAVGWIMVASGLVGNAIYVNPVKLAAHFFLAMVLMAYTFWFGLQLLVPPRERTSQPGRQMTVGVVLALVAVQLVYGALMAGNKAAPAAPTWPSINGRLWPAGGWQASSGLANLVANKITIHIIHRGTAYLILLGLLFFTWRAYRRLSDHPALSTDHPLFKKTYAIPAVIGLLQVTLGALTVLTSTQGLANHWGLFDWMAQLHQFVGMLLALSVIYVYYLVSGPVGRKA